MTLVIVTSASLAVPAIGLPESVKSLLVWEDVILHQEETSLNPWRKVCLTDDVGGIDMIYLWIDNFRSR